MNTADYELYQAGRRAASRGAGLSDCPYGGHDGHVWRSGAQAVIGAQDDTDGAQDGTQAASHPRRSFSDFWLRTAGPVPGTRRSG